MVSKINPVEKLSPDGSGRFFIMVALLNILNDKNKEIRLLDVGGSSPYMVSALESFAAPFNLTAIDILPKPKNFKAGYVQGDALNMTFANNSFDTVISTDVLEHIPLLKKIDFVRECLRVARDYVIIAAPFDTDAVDSAEHATNDFNKQLFNQGQSWLEEHFEYKKPSLEKILRFIEKEGYEVEVVGSNNIYNWVLSTHLNLIEAKLGLGNKKLVNINKTINKYLLLTNDMTPPFYRHFIVISKNKLTGSKKERIAALRNPTINYDESVAYIHNLLSLVSDKIRDSQTEFKQLEQTRNIEISYLKKEIDNMRHELADKQSIIDKCRPYLYLLRANPVSKVRRAIKSKKQIS